ncbi:hypothetical protein LX87_04086 [Larkinella arboricola]|uniref:Uncharacterized protein n=1 Tax=Larkinella arboricola TaxID=643671 RepID=A0A327WT64_LARAB|nr:hypothetical protein [Larkinella arboricola]RAJ94201.1 hypothetical protein LX87_04086 [Larkinella arboricola]
MKKVKIDGVSQLIPERWEECTEEQIQQLLPLQLVVLNEQEPQSRGRLKNAALRVLFPMVKKFEKDLLPEQLWALGQLTRWIWEKRLTHKPFESFEFEGVDYLLPDDNFSNTTAIEIAMANIHYLAYTRPENPNPRAVLQLVTTLCRPVRKDLKSFRKSADWNGDAREEYNTILADERAGRMTTLGLGVVMGVLQYFEAMNSRFVSMYREVYEPDPDAADLPPLYAGGEGLVTTLMEIAKTGTFGDFDKVCKQNGHTVWLFLKDTNLKIARAKVLAEQAEENE